MSNVPPERFLDSALRPDNWAEYIGQQKILAGILLQPIRFVKLKR
jgi:Holliday junction resolvasome RuvABC ATP-dependent DNA helicase subunit